MRTLLCIIIAVLCTNIMHAAPFSIIRGKVLDNTMQTPLSGSKIQLYGGEILMDTIADSEGVYRFDSIPVGRYRLEASLIGYKPVIINNIEVISGKESIVTIRMEESIFKKRIIRITPEKNKYLSQNEFITANNYIIAPDAINRYAGMWQDPARLAAVQAGVANGNNRLNDIIVRGNSPLGIGWYLDGAPIPNPNHFASAGTGGGLLPLINSNMLATSDFITGAFPAQYGNADAAIFDLKLRKGNANTTEGLIQAGLNGLQFGIEGPTGLYKNSSYITNIRFASFKAMENLGADFVYDDIPHYADFNVKLDFPETFLGDITFWGIGGSSKASLLNSKNVDNWDTAYGIEDENIESNMIAAGMRSMHFYNSKLFGEFTASYSSSIIHTNNKMLFNPDSLITNERYSGYEGSIYGKYSINYKIDRQHFVSVGFSTKYITYDNYFSNSNNTDVDSNVRMDVAGHTFLTETYAHWQYKASDDIQINSGLHFQTFALNGSNSLEPRFSIRYDLNDKNSIDLSYGLHSRTYPLLYYFTTYDKAGAHDNSDMKFTKSHHFAIGYNVYFARDFRIKANIYYQSMFDVPVSNISGLEWYSYANLGSETGIDPKPGIVNAGTGENYGIEFTFDKQFSNSYYFLLSAALFRSFYTGYDGIEHSTAFDMDKAINLLIGKEFELDNDGKYTISADIKLTLAGGRHVLPIDSGKSAELGYAVYNYSNAYAAKLDYYFQSDIKIDFKINLESTTHNFFIAIDNFTNHKNQSEQKWNPAINKTVYKHYAGIFPYFGYSFNF